MSDWEERGNFGFAAVDGGSLEDQGRASWIFAAKDEVVWLWNVCVWWGGGAEQTSFENIPEHGMLSFFFSPNGILRYVTHFKIV